MTALSDVLSTPVGRRRKFGEVSSTECTIQGNDFELISMVELEILKGYFGREFPAIYNHCGVMADYAYGRIISLHVTKRRKTLTFF